MRNETRAGAQVAVRDGNDGGDSGGATATMAAEAPQHLFGDYVEMVYLGLVILVGTTINIYVLRQLLAERRRSEQKHHTGFLMLKINLNLSDLLILVVHAFGKLIWLAEYEWRFGEALCRLFNFFSMFTLYLSSNIVVCIALDRLRTVVQAQKPLVARKQSIIRTMVILAWLLALVWSLPQLYFWRTINVFPEQPGGWIQCSDIWSIERYEMSRDANRPRVKSIFITNFVQNLYDLTHLCFVFYGPLLLLIVCYLFILARLLRFAKDGDTKSKVLVMSISHMPTSAAPKVGSVLARFQQALSDFARRVMLGDAKWRVTGQNNPRQFTDDELARFQYDSQTSPSSKNRSKSLVETACPRSVHTFANQRQKRLSYAPTRVTAGPVGKTGVRAKIYRYTRLNRGDRFLSASTLCNTITAGYSSSSGPADSPARSAKRVPLWCRQMKSRMFRTTLLVIVAHVILWLPYNSYALMKYINSDFYMRMNEKANVLKDLQFLITIINPFLYGFRQQ